MFSYINASLEVYKSKIAELNNYWNKSKFRIIKRC